MELALPDALSRKAAFDDGEHSWRVDTFPTVLREAASLGLACAGGQFQFRTSDGPICEMYELEVDTGGQRQGESWGSYVSRCEREVASAFEKILRDTDWRARALEWRDTIYSKAAAESADVRLMLVFVAYFENEDA